MKNFEAWFLAILSLIVLIFGITFYSILDFVVNPFKFVFSLIIIFGILTMVIIHILKQKEPHKRIIGSERILYEDSLI